MLTVSLGIPTGEPLCLIVAARLSSGEMTHKGIKLSLHLIVVAVNLEMISVFFQSLIHSMKEKGGCSSSVFYVTE